jgi:hypothetical protein
VRWSSKFNISPRPMNEALKHRSTQTIVSPGLCDVAEGRAVRRWIHRPIAVPVVMRDFLARKRHLLAGTSRGKVCSPQRAIDGRGPLLSTSLSQRPGPSAQRTLCRAFRHLCRLLLTLGLVVASEGDAQQSPWFNGGSPYGPNDTTFWTQLDRLPVVIEGEEDFGFLENCTPHRHYLGPESDVRTLDSELGGPGPPSGLANGRCYYLCFG